MNDNLRKAIYKMFEIIGQQPPDDSVFKEPNWYQKYCFTEAQQDYYIEWLTDFLKTNWKGITEFKPTNKKTRERVAKMFNFIYGLKVI
jgi:hypothetical protein